LEKEEEQASAFCSGGGTREKGSNRPRLRKKECQKKGKRDDRAVAQKEGGGEDVKEGRGEKENSGERRKGLGFFSLATQKGGRSSPSSVQEGRKNRLP